MSETKMASLPPVDRNRAAVRSTGGLNGVWRRALPQRNTALVRGICSLVAALSDGAAIILCALLSGMLYHRAAYAAEAELDMFLRQGTMVALLFVVPNIVKREYSVGNFLTFAGHVHRTFTMWNIAFMCSLIVAFLTKTSADISRGSVIAFYICGYGLLVGVRFILVRIVHDQAQAGGVTAKRVFLVGFEEDVRRFNDELDPRTLGMRVVAASVLRGKDTLEEDLALAAATARIMRPEDVFILVPWSQSETIDACVNAFLRVPASIHLGAERVLKRFADSYIERMGPISSLHLVRKPLTTFEIVQKRVFDLIVASLALVFLAPFFLVMAILIKLDSSGPVFFMQRRYGFNQEPFRIFKFRSMTSMDDGRVIVQATAGDARITRVGAFMRRFNIDELPQLLNVIRGEMSLVGPRPHALAHDQQYERTIALYARRHNVKPGITGWAQVSGLRGETASEEKMRRRVEHDLHYIDNWSMMLDIKIMFLTVFSGKAYRNAR